MPTDQANNPSLRPSLSLVAFGIVTSALIILAHAVAYMTHEYSHSFVAWLLGWMANPMGLDYGHATLNNFLFLGEVSDNVNYDPIFTSGHGFQASVIALAGVVIGNAAPYFILYRSAGSSWVARNPIRLSLVFWLSLMCAGNVWSYVPVRALTTHADIAIAARGFGVSPWIQFPFLLAPALYVVFHFFTRMCSRSLAGMTGKSAPKMAMTIALTSYWFFAFFVGDAAGGDYGAISLLLAIASKYLLFPLCVMWLWERYVRDYISARHSSAYTRGI